PMRSPAAFSAFSMSPTISVFRLLNWRNSQMRNPVEAEKPMAAIAKRPIVMGVSAASIGRLPARPSVRRVVLRRQPRDDVADGVGRERRADGRPGLCDCRLEPADEVVDEDLTQRLEGRGAGESADAPGDG